MFFASAVVRAEDGYRLWLRYDRIEAGPVRDAYAAALGGITFVTPEGAESATISAAREELTAGIGGMIGVRPEITVRAGGRDDAPAGLGDEGFSLRVASDGRGVVIAANRDAGALYGAFELLRMVQTRRTIDAELGVVSVPRVARRVINHWDNLNGFVERGYAGFSLWKWFTLPEVIEPRYRDYARAQASVGVNGVCLTNVNADALVLTPGYLRKVAALADVFRPYGIRVYLTARFSAPLEIGGLATADPLDENVRGWWRGKTDEVYKMIPDFGGFVVKANSEGQPGPQNYGRSHAEGANMLADAAGAHGGVVFWRAFVYEADAPDDRAKQAYNEFTPLDGKFRANVIVQVKNGAIDFMPREPFHPLFGAMPRTALALELQITQEYLGAGTHLAFLAPLFKEALDADTFAGRKAGATVGKIVSGELGKQTHGLAARAAGAIVGVANTGDERNWTGHPLAAANWYAFGRLAWNPSLAAGAIADEWVRMTFSNEARVVRTVSDMLLESREAVVNYEMPLGLHHIMAVNHHYGPGPWVDAKVAGRADWSSVYYHRADEAGVGFDRTAASGSGATSQYAAGVRERFESLRECPENLLLWFHHVPWDHRMKSGRTLWDELCAKYQGGVDAVEGWQGAWAGLRGAIDAERHERVAALLRIQLGDAREWRDACLLYFQTFSQRDFPKGVGKPVHSLEYYKGVRRFYVPGTPGGK